MEILVKNPSGTCKKQGKGLLFFIEFIAIMNLYLSLENNCSGRNMKRCLL